MYFDVCTVHLAQFIIQTNQYTSAFIGLYNKKYRIGVVIFSTYFRIYVISNTNSSKEHWFHIQTMHSDEECCKGCNPKKKITCLQFHHGGRKTNVSQKQFTLYEFP
jgi:hypothetical protein